MTKILVIYPHTSSFIERDLEILAEGYKVDPFLYKGKEQLLKLTRKIFQNDINLSWFALGYATTATAISKFVGKKSVIIAGGWDVVSMPEIGYGAMLDKERIKKTKYALNNAAKVIAVSESTRKDVLQWVDRDVDVIHLGFNPNKYKPSGEKEDLIITVASIRENTIKLKGLDTFIETARALPKYRFAIIGDRSDTSADRLKSTSPDNVEFLGYLSDENLLKYYRKAKVYAQLSYQESFGSALAEAMLCECVPVVTKRGAMPEVVGDAGFYTNYGDPDLTSTIIEKALNSASGTKARRRIVENFSLVRRKEALKRVIDDAIL
jgi:glycosyltransferase involved in cell wall biosynthesis